jgi:hypothetical protein
MVKEHGFSALPPARPSRYVLCYAIAKRPVLFRDFNEINEHIFWPETTLLAQQLDDSPVQRFSGFKCPALAHRDLDDYKIVRAADIQILGVVNEVRLSVFGDQLKAVLLGNGDRFHQGTVNRIRYLSSIRVRPTFQQ